MAKPNYKQRPYSVRKPISERYQDSIYFQIEDCRRYLTRADGNYINEVERCVNVLKILLSPAINNNSKYKKIYGDIIEEYKTKFKTCPIKRRDDLRREFAEKKFGFFCYITEDRYGEPESESWVM